jgi:hypothetical protein
MTEALMNAKPEDDPTHRPPSVSSTDEYPTPIDADLLLNNEGKIRDKIKTKDLLEKILKTNITHFKKQEKEKEHLHYEEHEVKTLRAMYIMAIIIWILLIVGVGLLNYKEGRLLYLIICFIPIAIFSYTFIILGTTNLSTQNVFKSNVVSIGLLFFFPLFAQMMTFNHADIITFTKMMIIGFSISLISLYDVWTDSRDNAILQHTKTILHTYAITLVLASLCFYFIIKSTQIKAGHEIVFSNIVQQPITNTTKQNVK